MSFHPRLNGSLDKAEVSLPRALAARPEKALLLQPPVHDTRLNWAQWQQPSQLLRVASHLRRNGASLKLIDALDEARLNKRRHEIVEALDVDGQRVQRRRYGLDPSVIAERLRELERGGWVPDQVYIECFTTFWWKGAAETAALAREVFPAAELILLGEYATATPKHAAEHVGADEYIGQLPAPLTNLPADLSLCDTPPPSLLVSFGDGTRTAEEVVEEVVAAVRARVRAFAFLDSLVAQRYPERYREVLELLAERKLGVKFYALGNLEYADVLCDRELPDLMRQAGYAQINFADDRHLQADTVLNEMLVEDCREVATLCHAAGFSARTDALSAGLSLGRRGEDLAARSRLATLLSHHMGSVIVWPYQPVPEECPGVPLEDQNGKLFPLRRENGHTYRDYLEVVGLAAILNAKYRSRTFDFLGDGLMPRLFRDSVRRRGWDPDPVVKGGLVLPVRPPR